MIFGFFGKKQSDDDHDDEEEEIELVSFQGAINGVEPDMKANAKLQQVGLVPAKEFVTDAITRRAEAVRLDIKGEKAQSTLIVDGMPYAGSRMSRQQALAVSQMLKLLAGLDPKGKGKTGGIKSDYTGHPWEVTVESTPGPEGQERLTVRLRDLKAKLNSVEDLGFPPAVKEKIREATSHKKGIVLVCGPAASGLTTTLHATVRAVDMYLYSIFVTAKLGNRDIINVTKFEELEGDSLEQTFARIARAEADIVFAETVRDAETAKIITDTADRMTMMTDMAAKDAAHGLSQFTQLVGEPAKVAERMNLVLSSKMLRKLCEDCKEAFRPNPKLLAKVGLPPEVKTLYKKGEPIVDEKTGQAGDDCATCGGVGYVGRIAMLEVIDMTEGMRQVIAAGAAPDQIRAQMRNDNMQTLQKDGLRLVAEGKTSLEELQRVFKAPA